MGKKNKTDKYLILTALSLLSVLFLLSMLTGKYVWTKNPVDSYSLQAASWIEGRLDVDSCEDLELAIFHGKYYVSFPPFPSYVLIPFSFFFGTHTPDALIHFVVDMFAAVYLYRIDRHYHLDPQASMISCGNEHLLCDYKQGRSSVDILGISETDMLTTSFRGCFLC